MRASQKRYEQTEKGKATKARYQSQPHVRSEKALLERYRIRIPVPRS